MVWDLFGYGVCLAIMFALVMMLVRSRLAERESRWRADDLVEKHEHELGVFEMRLKHEQESHGLTRRTLTRTIEQYAGQQPDLIEFVRAMGDPEILKVMQVPGGCPGVVTIVAHEPPVQLGRRLDIQRRSQLLLTRELGVELREYGYRFTFAAVQKPDRALMISERNALLLAGAKMVAQAIEDAEAQLEPGEMVYGSEYGRLKGGA
jgi:hypothetical protein